MKCQELVQRMLSGWMTLRWSLLKIWYDISTSPLLLQLLLQLVLAKLVCWCKCRRVNPRLRSQSRYRLGQNA